MSGYPDPCRHVNLPMLTEMLNIVGLQLWGGTGGGAAGLKASQAVRGWYGLGAGQPLEQEPRMYTRPDEEVRTSVKEEELGGPEVKNIENVSHQI